jgi:hypothetical protein
MWQNSILHSLGVAFTYSFALPIWLGLGVGLVRVTGRQKIVSLIKRGNVILVANHPSLLEVIALPALFWHWLVNNHAARVPYSIADEHFFGDCCWLQRSCRNIPVSREGNAEAAQKNGRVLRLVKQQLEQNDVLVYYPEGGRTCKGELYQTYGNRVVRRCNSKTLNLIAGDQTVVIPVWIDHGEINQPLSLWQGYKRLLRGVPLQINFGDAVQVPDGGATDDWLANQILHAG